MLTKDAVPHRYVSKTLDIENFSLITPGFGIQKLTHALIDSHRDKKGLNLPLDLCRFPIAIIPVKNKDIEAATQLYLRLTRIINRQVLIEDQFDKRISRRIDHAYLYGCKILLLLSTKENSSQFRIQMRGQEEFTDTDIESFIQTISTERHQP